MTHNVPPTAADGDDLERLADALSVEPDLLRAIAQGDVPGVALILQVRPRSIIYLSSDEGDPPCSASEALAALDAAVEEDRRELEHHRRS